MTLWRWLERAVERGLASRAGKGTRTEPFQYWLPEQEAVWRNDPTWVLEEQARETREMIEQMIGAGRGGVRRD